MHSNPQQISDSLCWLISLILLILSDETLMRLETQGFLNEKSCRLGHLDILIQKLPNILFFVLNQLSEGIAGNAWKMHIETQLVRQLPRPGHGHNVSKPWGTFRRLGWINETHHLKQGKGEGEKFLASSFQGISRDFWIFDRTKRKIPRSPLAIVQAIPAKQVEQRRNLRGT